MARISNPGKSQPFLVIRQRLGVDLNELQPSANSIFISPNRDMIRIEHQPDHELLKKTLRYPLLRTRGPDYPRSVSALRIVRAWLPAINWLVGSALRRVGARPAGRP